MLHSKTLLKKNRQNFHDVLRHSIFPLAREFFCFLVFRSAYSEIWVKLVLVYALYAL